MHKKKIRCGCVPAAENGNPSRSWFGWSKRRMASKKIDQPARAGEISLDLTGRKPGRGAYVCKNVDCLKAARKARRLERAFACQIPSEVYDRLEEEIQK